MSWRTLIEINHDLVPHATADLLAWAQRIQNYSRSGAPSELPYGVTFVARRHHSEPAPVAKSEESHDA